MSHELVLVEREDLLAIVTINRPSVRNALNTSVFRQLDRALDRIADDREIRAVIITGAGDTFAAGADINELLSMDSVQGWYSSRFGQSVFNKIERLNKPSLAAINGAALGGGLELALSCTLRFASNKAKMGFPELGLGILPGFGGTQRIIRAVGRGKAAEMILLRSIIGAEEAKTMGLVNGVWPPGQVMAAAKEAARSISELSPVAVHLAMALLNNSQDEGFEPGLALESAVASLTLSSQEAKELLSRIVKKSRP
jgi:enoyl-CoA hydratase